MTRKILAVALSIFCLFSCAKPAGDLDAEAFSKILSESESSQLLDVRTPEEFSEGHIPNAVNIDWYEDDFIENAKASLDPKRQVMVYCRSGKRSAAAAAKLRENGFKTYNLLGGFLSWKEAGKEVVSGWALLGFGKPSDINPVITPDGQASFFCPMRKDSVRWEEGATFNPAATVVDGKIVVLYRSEDDLNQGIGTRTSRLGYASSPDGLHFERKSEPVFYPGEDGQEEFEWPGGCEDPRIAVTSDGTYVMTYTQWNRKCPRLAVATSRNLVDWEKHGPVFREAYGGRFMDMPSKSASIVTGLRDGSQVIEKVNGKYLMYWGERFVNIATSDDLVNWTPVLGEDGELLRVMEPREGFFDSQLTECGPPAIMTDEGILLVYNGKNQPAEGRSMDYPANTYCAGQALFDKRHPERLIARLDKPFLVPESDFERTGQYAAGTVFTEGMAYHDGKWFIYYGCADSRVGVAVRP